MKKPLALAAALLWPALASPASLADQLALTSRAVRGPCPAPYAIPGAQCATASNSLETTRLLIDVNHEKLFTSPWRQAGTSVLALVTQGAERLEISLHPLSQFKTLIRVQTLFTQATPQLPAAAPTGITTPSVHYNTVVMLVSAHQVGTKVEVRRLNKVAPASFLLPYDGRILVPVSSLEALGCTVRTLAAGGLSRVSCAFPYVGTLSADTIVLSPLP